MQTTFKQIILAIAYVIACFTTSVIAHGDYSGPANSIKANVVFSEALANVPGKALTVVEVDVPPGASSPSHQHAGTVYVYVLEGTVRSQLNNGEVVDYKKGESWIEPPGTVHSMTENPSKTENARVMAVFVAEEGAQLRTMDEPAK
jgi:quercetin dioxygenase-like cupin family protein